MQNFLKTIIFAVQTWAKGKIKDSTADWNQNDSSADNYVKNRPFYEEGAIVPIFSSTLVTTENKVYNADYYYGYTDERQQLVVGETYTVTFDGVDYMCRCEVYHLSNDTEVWGLGNHSFESKGIDHNNEPFLICVSTTGSNGPGSHTLVKATKQGVHTFSISQIREVVHKLDSKYLYDFVIKGKGGYHIDYIYEPLPAGTYEMVTKRLKNKQPITAVFQMEYQYDDGRVEHGTYIAFEFEWIPNDGYVYISCYDYYGYLYPDDRFLYDTI